MPSDYHALLWADYGPIMDAKSLCKVLHYPSPKALNIARMKGVLPFSPITYQGRRGLFALTQDIAEVLQRAEANRILSAYIQREQPAVAQQEVCAS